MKKNSFMQGAAIATISIIVTKIIGIIYVIPFYNIIGDKGGALYGYAYTIYSTFLSLSTVGIPLAISKVVSEYNALGYEHTRERVYKQGKRAITIFAVLIFLILFIFAGPIAKLILGDIEGGNTIEDIKFVIRVIATALLVIPSLSIARGYLQGNKYITESSISQVVEQLFRVIVVVFGSYLVLLFTDNVTWAVSISCFGATFGVLLAYFYLRNKIRKNKADFKPCPMKEEEKSITTKDIWVKIFKYAFPFVMIDIVSNFCQLITMFTVVKILVNHAGYSITDAEIVMSTITTWGNKLCMIITAIGTGLVVSILPHITSSYILKDMKTVGKYINQSFEVLLYLSIPMTFGLSFLAKPVWEVFYGNHGFAAEVFSAFVITGLVSGMYSVTLTIMQSLDRYKVVFYSLFAEVAIKAILQYPLMILCHKIGIGAYVGNIASTALATCATFIIFMIYMEKKMNISLKDTYISTVKILLYSVIMYAVLLLLGQFIPVEVSGRMNAILVIVIYTLVGGGLYFLLTYKTLFKKVFGKELIDKFLKKFKKA